MIALIAATALASSVLLRVGVHVDAGDVRDVAADGASGQCTSGPSWISCPASGPVSFRWGPGGDWTLTGDVVVEPDREGIAWVWAPDASRAEDLAAMAPDRVTPGWLRSRFVDDETPASAGMIEALAGLAEHPDPEVRRAVVECLQPLAGRSMLGPMPPTAPIPFPGAVLERLAADRDQGVRRRVAVMLRDLRPSPLDPLVVELLTRLALDPVAGVRRAAMGSLPGATAMGAMEAEDAWREAIAVVPQSGGPGRMAINALARLALYAEPSDVIDPPAAVALALEYHPERVWRLWTAWRDHVPFREDWAGTLLRGTVGYSPALLRHWASEDPAGLERALHEWEPAEPHSERFDSVVAAIASDAPPGEAPPEEAPAP